MSRPTVALAGPDRQARAELRRMAARLTRWDPDLDRPAEREASRAAWQTLARLVVEHVADLCDRADQVETLLEGEP